MKRRHHKPTVVWTKELYDLVVELYRTPMSATQVAVAMGPDWTRNMVCGALRRVGEKRPDGWVNLSRHGKDGVAMNAKRAAARAAMRAAAIAQTDLEGAPVEPMVVVRRRVPAVDAPLRDRILYHLHGRQADTMDLALVCGTKELIVSQTLAVLAHEGVVISQPSNGPRSVMWGAAA